MKNSFNVELVNGGEVSDNKVMLSGSALAGIVLQVFDTGTLKGEVTVGADYKWQSPFIPIAEGQHSFTVKEKAGNQLESDPWEIERLVFSADLTQMKLNGVSVKVSGLPLTGHESINNTGVRLARGGVPPYAFASGSPLIASVTDRGKVTGHRNGTVPIYISDQEGKTLTFLAAVTNVFTLWESDVEMTNAEAVLWIANKGPDARPVCDEAIYDLHRVYDLTSLHHYYWMGSPAACAFPDYRSYFRKDGGVRCHAQDLLFHAWCIQPI